MSDLPAQLPWIAGAVGMLSVFFGMLAVQWRLIGALDRALERQQVVPSPQHPMPPVPPVASPAKPPAPPVQPPPPAGPFASAPPWFQAALHEIGFHETGANQGIERYIQLAHCGAVGDPWCAIFANAMLESSGTPGTRSASSQSFRSHPGFVQLSGPALGAIAVFWRGTRDSGLGHVGFYRGEDASRVWTLGGNESDMVEIAALPKDSSSFGLIGYWWPAGVAKPTTGAVMMPAGSPTTVTAPPTSTAAPSGATGAVQKAITATMFGGQQSAYGGAIDDNSPGVALPFRFTGARPRVRVTKAGVSVDCDIVDVGPWLTDDPYWETGARPIAEGRAPLPRGPNAGKISNGAGIDLTFAAAKAIQVDGKGLVDWQFITTPAAPAVT